MTDNVELPLPQNSYAEQVVLAGCMRDALVSQLGELLDAGGGSDHGEDA